MYFEADIIAISLSSFLMFNQVTLSFLVSVDSFRKDQENLNGSSHEDNLDHEDQEKVNGVKNSKSAIKVAAVDSIIVAFLE